MPEKKTIAYLGPEGTFSANCFQKIDLKLPGQFEGVVFSSLDDIYTALLAGDVDYALMPVENSLGGNVHETIDALGTDSPGNIRVCLEWVMQIDHNLAGFGDLSEIECIYAHPQAAAQCRAYLKANFNNLKKIESLSNAHAAEDLRAISNPQYAAITTGEAAERLGLPIIQTGINDNPSNLTRFWLIGTEPIEVNSSQSLSSFAFQIPRDRPGGLIEILKPFSESNINLTRIISRPTRGSLCEYTFYIDYIDNIEQPFDLSRIEPLCSEWKVLGHYSILPEGDQRFAG